MCLKQTKRLNPVVSTFPTLYCAHSGLAHLEPFSFVKQNPDLKDVTKQESVRIEPINDFPECLRKTN